jgi:hypothetical protein
MNRDLVPSPRPGAYLQDVWTSTRTLEITSGVAQSQVVGRTTTAGDLSPA